MGDQFVGLTVFLTIRGPEPLQLRGLVAAVADQQLALTNG